MGEHETRPACECFVTPESMWLSAASCGYGSGYEPGSQMEWNPACPVHLRREICDECAEPIDETDLAPSCGAHRLHLDCRGRFDCRWCDEEWEEANS